MRKHNGARLGEGTAWLVADRLSDHVHCYWYAGVSGGQLIEHADADSARDAVAWGLERTPRVRIRTREGETQWAGTEARPEMFATSWSDPPVP
jgi:hypothetical protein